MRALLRRDFPPLVGNDCDRNSGYTTADRYIRHGNSKEEEETAAPDEAADTRFHDDLAPYLIERARGG